MTTPVRITLRVVLVYKISPISQVRKHEPFFPLIILCFSVRNSTRPRPPPDFSIKRDMPKAKAILMMTMTAQRSENAAMMPFSIWSRTTIGAKP